MTDKSLTNDELWRDKLTSEQFSICRLKATEPPFTGKYNDCKKMGVYHCICCDNPLFDSETKYDSGSGWPSFWSDDMIGQIFKDLIQVVEDLNRNIEELDNDKKGL